ncbi:LexA family protein [Clostridium perfringens]|uniref:LexA family protein n=1 Tax=Clostridium perfringens TaxID=1502 RepID=UPI0039E780AD
MKKREQIYKFLIDFIKDKGYQPTVREIAHAVNLNSFSSVYRHLEIIKKSILNKKRNYSNKKILSLM